VAGGARCAAGAADELCARGRCRHFDGWKWSNVTKPSLLGWARRSTPIIHHLPLPTPNEAPPKPHRGKSFLAANLNFFFSVPPPPDNTGAKLKTDLARSWRRADEKCGRRRKKVFCVFFTTFVLCEGKVFRQGSFTTRRVISH
jgi:hypothetical protein